jgi:hypothetical protein
MSEPQSTTRVSDDVPAEQGEEARPRTAALPAARLLANPRRIRRD